MVLAPWVLPKVKGREVQQREENNGKEEKTMAKGNAQCNGRREKP